MTPFKPTLILIILVIGITCETKSQEHKQKFGFYFEGVRRNNTLKTKTSYFPSINQKNQFGVGMGANFLIENSRLVSYRFSSGLVYEKDVLKFYGDELKRGSISVKLPVHVLLRLKHNSDLRFVGGFTPAFRVIGKDETGDLNFNPWELTGDIGLGYFIEVERFSIMPELKYSHAIIDGKSSAHSFYEDSIDRYKRNKFSLMIILTKKG